MLKKHIPVVIVLINLKSRRQNRYFGLQVSNILMGGTMVK